MEYLRFISKTDDPTQEHRGYSNLHKECEMTVSVWNQHSIFAKSVDDNIDEVSVKSKLNSRRITCIHLKQAVCMVIERFPCEFRTGDSNIGSKMDIAHSVNSVRCDSMPL